MTYTQLPAGGSANNKFQRITLAQDVTANNSDISGTTGNSAFKFAGLTVGKVYRVSVNAFFQITGTSASESAGLYAVNGSNTVLFLRHRNDAVTDTSDQMADCQAIFTATATTCRFGWSIGGTVTLKGAGNYEETHAMIEELNNYEVTTDFTNP